MILSKTQPESFVSVVKRICILHKHSDVTYITLKDQLKYSVDASVVSQDTLSVVQRIIKEILRQTNEILTEKNEPENGLKKPDQKVSENLV